MAKYLQCFVIDKTLSFIVKYNKKSQRLNTAVCLVIDCHLSTKMSAATGSLHKGGKVASVIVRPDTLA